ncbi:MAG: BACON domain-containing protein [Dysgonomonas sp.]
MRKYLLLFAFTLSAILAGCSSDDETDGNSQIKVDDKNSLTQTVYADNNEGKSGVKFSTTGAWTSTIKETGTQKDASTSASEWITISPDHGTAAGDYTMNIALQTNYTGKDRAATITIVCGDTNISITVTQEGKTEDGDIPEEVINMNYISSIERSRIGEEEYASTMEFTYNAANEITTVKDFDTFKIKFEYIKDTLSYTYGNRPEDKTVLILNNKGYATSANTFAGGYWDATYNGDYIARVVGKDYQDYDRKTEWKDGNMIKVIDEEGFEAVSEYGTKKNNAAINLDLNWILGSVECWDFLVNDEEPFHTVLLSAMDHYGKRSEYYKTKVTNATYGNAAYQDVKEYDFQTNDKGLVTKIVITRYYLAEPDEKTVYEYKINYKN